MKNFRQFFFEMSVPDAYKVLGIQPSQRITQVQLKQIYRNLARINHPDKGGDLKKMQDINVAFEIISKQTGVNIQGDSRTEWNNKTQRFGEMAKKEILGKIDLRLFERYFQDIFGEKFDSGIRAKILHSRANIIDIVFSNSDRTIVLNFHIYNDFSRIIDTIGSQSFDMDVGLRTEILYHRRSVKLFQQNYQYKQSINLLRKPENIFPRQKLLQQIQKSSSRQFSKRDALLILRQELGAIVQQDFAFIPLNKDLRLAIYRSTMMKSAFWGVNGIYEKFGRVVEPKAFPTVFINEDAESFNLFVNEIKKIPKTADLEFITKRLHNILMTIKQKRT